jgi:predicted acyltransferase
MTIAAMILVNMPGSWSYVYAPLQHAHWHGCTPTDLIFPFFLFIVGTAMSYSFVKFNNTATSAIILKILKRAFLILLIGLALNAFPFQTPISGLRIPGVLQRIALAYGMAALLCLWLQPRHLIILSGFLLIGYWLMMFGFAKGNPYALETNLVRIIDIKLFGEQHLWHGKKIAFDPEGLLSTLPAVVTVISGYLAGRLIQAESNLNKSVLKLFSSGAAAVLLGVAWGIIFPINKYLWTSSYVLYTSGWAMICLALLLWVVDIKRFTNWNYPFVVFGTNSLFVYIASILWIKVFIYLIKIPTSDGSVVSGYNWIFTQAFAPVAGNLNGSLLFAFTHLGFFWFILFILYRQKIFIKI